MRTITLPGEFSDAVVVSEADESELAEWLTGAERTRANEFKLQRRRTEWATSRVAAKIALQRRGVLGLPGAVSLQGPLGRPARIPERDLYVSFSHGHGLAAAVVSDVPVGIDVEMARSLAPRMRKFFLTASDDDATACVGDDALIHLWSAKEAAFKAIATLELLTQVRFERCEPAAGGFSVHFEGAGARGNVLTVRIDAFVLAVARVTANDA